ncbi:outer membrane protein [Dyella sp.]|uniref:outer membrane protein n=1 Tax=Dyella sp. TaxID=1869338 RepID=UPI002ED1F982
MNKFLSAAVLAVLGAASATASADEGNFFVNGNIGQANWRDGSAARSLYAIPGVERVKQDNTGPAGQLRVGYRWRSVVDYGVELGYAYLGERTVNYSGADFSNNLKQKSRGYMLGGNLNWNITDQWYVSGRAGWYRGRAVAQERNYDAVGRSAGTLASNMATGEYMGLGAGYNINQHFSVGLNYDRFHLPGQGGVAATTVNMTTIGGEFRY